MSTFSVWFSVQALCAVVNVALYAADTTRWWNLAAGVLSVLFALDTLALQMRRPWK